MKLVYVEWRDSTQMSGWKFLEEIEAPAACSCRSVGWLIREEERAIMVSGHIGSGSVDDDINQACGTIPRECIMEKLWLMP